MAAYATRRLLTLLAVAVLTPSATFVILTALRDGTTLWAQAARLPRYLSDTFLHLDLGVVGPPTQPQPIRDLVLDGLPVDLALLVGGIVLGVAGGLGAGLLAGARPRGAVDRALGAGSALAISMPVYWFANVTLFVFAPGSGTFQIPFFSETSGYVPPGRDPLGWLQAMWVPWVVLALPLGALCYRMVRSALADVVEEDVLRTARAKGLRERLVLRRHALPLALPPVIGLVSANVALVITNIALIEHPFNLPGAFRFADIGQFRGEVGAHSPALDIVQALIVEAAFLVALAMLVCDVLLAWLDPRMREHG
ncbi:MAG TPA: ABC transporter permease [Solirubrobacteraceae bacterium]|nr:ABC transporter permease [Solirubrobacteraceae bacterium]